MGHKKDSLGAVKALQFQEKAGGKRKQHLADLEAERSKLYFSTQTILSQLVIHPHSPFTKNWDLFIAVLLFYTAYVTPFDVGFLETKLDGLFVINQIVNMGFVMDMAKTFFTAYFDPDTLLMVGDLSKIRNKYFKSWFCVDLVSILPFDSVGLSTDSEALSKAKAARVIRLLRLLKLLRLVRSLRILTRYQDHIGIKYATKRLFQSSALIITTMHWFACTLRLLPAMFIFINPDTDEEVSWMTATSNAGVPLVDCNHWTQYCWALYWASMTLTTIGYGDISAQTTAEAVMMTCAMCIGSVMYAYAIGEVCSIIANMDEATSAYNSQSDLLNTYCKDNALPRALVIRLRQYFRQNKHIQRSHYFKGLLDIMSPTLRSEVTIFLNAEVLTRIPFFQIPNQVEFHRFLAEITSKMEARLYAQEETVINLGDRMKGVNLVTRGIAFGGVAFGTNQKWGIFTVGQWFGTEGLLLERRHMYEVKAVKILEVEFISKYSLDHVIDSGDFTGVHKQIRKACAKCMFLLSIKRYVERLQKSGKQSVLEFLPTAAELAYIREGVFADLSKSQPRTVSKSRRGRSDGAQSDLNNLQLDMSVMQADMSDVKASIRAIHAAVVGNQQKKQPCQQGRSSSLPVYPRDPETNIESMDAAEIEAQLKI